MAVRSVMASLESPLIRSLRTLPLPQLVVSGVGSCTNSNHSPGFPCTTHARLRRSSRLALHCGGGFPSHTLRCRLGLAGATRLGLSIGNHFVLNPHLVARTRHRPQRILGQRHTSFSHYISSGGIGASVGVASATILSSSP